MTELADNSMRVAGAAGPLPKAVKPIVAARALGICVRQVYRQVEADDLRTLNGKNEHPMWIVTASLPAPAQERLLSWQIHASGPDPAREIVDDSPQLSLLPRTELDEQIEQAKVRLNPLQVAPVMQRFRGMQFLSNHDYAAMNLTRKQAFQNVGRELGLSCRQTERIFKEYSQILRESGVAAAIQSLSLNKRGPQKFADTALDPSTEQGRSLRGFITDCWENRKLTRKQTCVEVHSYVAIKQRGAGASYIYQDPSDQTIIRFINTPAPHGLGGDRNPRRNGPEAMKEAAGYIDCTYDDEYAADTWCIDEWELDGAFYNAQKRREIFWSLYMVSVIDERTTRILDWTLAYHLNAETVLDLLERCVRTFGPPLYLRSDRGGHFRGRVLGRRLVQMHGKIIERAVGALGPLGVKPVLPRDKNPRADRIERLHRIYSDRAQRDFGPSWRGRNTEERQMTGIDNRVKDHVQKHCKQGICGPLILSTADAERIVTKWVEEVNLADTDARGCQGMSRLAAFKEFSPPAQELERRRKLATPELIDMAFAEHDKWIIRAGGVIEWRDHLRYSSPDLAEHAGELVPMLRYRRDTLRLLVEIDGATVVAERRIPVGRNDEERCAEENRKLNHVRKLLARARPEAPTFENAPEALQSEVPLAGANEAKDLREISSTEWMATHRRGIPEPREEGVGYPDLE